MNQNIRVRFAPSPTGPLHIGGLRTALYNYLFARRHGGRFLLRIEDTDRSRLVPGAEDYINQALAWLGIEPDEGVLQGGAFGPYRQSDRRDIYQEYALQMLHEGHAYYAFDTPEELEAMRERLKGSTDTNPVYDTVSRKTMHNSLTLPESEVQRRLGAGMPWVIRLKVPEGETIELDDIIRGTVKVESAHIDDKVLIKSDGMPTYHLANVVDDHLMQISHVIRGEEWLPSAPLHVLLYRFLGWSDTMPRFAHLPLLLKPEGTGKLSKRDAERGGFPIFPLEWRDPASGQPSLGFREEGYLPEATLNFLAMLGWNPGTDQELFTRDDLIREFSLERIVKAGAKFDIEKAKWFNQQYLRQMPDAALAAEMLRCRPPEYSDPGTDKALAIAGLMKERVTFISEIWTKAEFFFRQPQEYDSGILAKKWTGEIRDALSEYALALRSEQGELTASRYNDLLQQVLAARNMPPGKIMQVLRVVLTGSGAGPDLMPSMVVLGRTENIARIDRALRNIQN
jgi:glutamyl-tRNA synthetase